ncbi:MAG: cell division protein FtsZ [Candidatus Aminicenantes bacterium]|nr:cell division protein FtsZ [Candidatus Aminicenantes bacterium]
MKEDSGKGIKFSLAEDCSGANIKVIGIGGGGGNALNRMIAMGIEGVECIAVNTDLQALSTSRARTKIQIGSQSTKGLGSGGRPEVGRQAAEEDKDKLLNALQGADMVFLTAGLGGGTGTGATPLIAKMATDLDLLLISVVTLPFSFEMKYRCRQAEDGLKELKSVADTVIAIPNDRLLQTSSEETMSEDAFRMADDVLRQAVQGITDLITKPGLINLDFADVRTVMKNMGQAYLGTGCASGHNRVVEAAQRAISSPLLCETSIEGAKGILINITGGKDLGLLEVSRAAEIVNRLAHPEANVIFGMVIDDSMKDKAKVTVIATGFNAASKKDKAAPAGLLRPFRKTPEPFPIQIEPPDYPFDGRAIERSEVLGAAQSAEEPYSHLETPTFIRNKHLRLKKFAQ